MTSLHDESKCDTAVVSGEDINMLSGHLKLCGRKMETQLMNVTLPGMHGD